MKRVMRRTWKQVRFRLVSGLLVLVPLAITIFILRLLLGFLQDFIQPLVRVLRQHWDFGISSTGVDWLTPILAILLVICALFLVGSLTTYVVGRRAIKAAEALMLRIPGVSAIYSASRQLVDAIGGKNKNAFESVVELAMFSGVHQTIGFVTATIPHEGEEKYMVFVPTAPNPMSGFLLIAKKEHCKLIDISVEDALKLIMSAGLLSNTILPGTQSGPE
ncbi:MAG TPA: hypothetical protein DCR55_13365 [Lentisphaeria bacterium]|nr:hypothetical protein [Lentisphaeria bacterium]